MSPQIFLSANRADEPWLDAIRRHLAPYQRRGLSVWDPRDIEPGARPASGLAAALARARIAVLLVSPHYLAEEFLAGALHDALMQAKARGLRLCWVPLSAGAFDVAELAELRPLHDPRRPLDLLPEADRQRVLADICERIARLSELDGDAPLPRTLAGCFTPPEFVAEVLGELDDAPRANWPLPSAGADARERWFDDATTVCEQRGLLREPEFWTAIQRARPERCEELHHARRRHIAPDREPAPPRVAAIDGLVDAVVRRFATPPAVAELLDDVGLREPPPPATSASALLYWALASLVRSRAGTALFRLARALRRLDLSQFGKLGVVERLAICACDEQVPASLQATWLDVRGRADAAVVSFRAWDPPSRHDAELPLHAGGSTRELALGLSLSIEVDASGRAFDLAVRARSDGPWLGQTLRLCQGVRSLVRRLIAPRGDHLGQSAQEVLVMLERCEIEEES